MKFLDLFAGIGGFHLGMEQAGHTCVGWVEWDKFARQSYQAIHNVKGMWNASDIRTVRASELPRADCWCFGFPCQDISVAGKQKGFTAGKRSSLFFTVTGLIRDLEEEDRPSYLLIENVKNLLSINRGLDFLKLQIELDEIGYDVEWDVLDSAEVVPQHRERIFIIGHLRGRCTRKVFPIVREDGETNKTDKVVNQIGNISNSKSFGGNPQVGRVYGADGISPTLSTMQGGGQEPKIMVKDNKINMVIGSTQKNASVTDGTYSPTLTSAMGMGGGQIPMIVNHSDCLDAREAATNVSQGVKVESKPVFGRLGQQAADTMNANEVSDFDIIEPFNHRVHKDQISPTITTRPEGLKTAILPVTNNLRIRKLTPLECWRLQGFPDWAFDRAKQAGLSDSQLYKQAGNSVTVPVIKAIAENMAFETIGECLK